MYKPDLDEGWFKIANGMLPMLLAARFRIDAVVVLSEALAQLYGKAKRPYAVLDIPGLSARWGLQRSNAWRGLADLKRSGVLAEVAGVATNVRFSKQALLDNLPPNIRQGVANYSMLAKSYDRLEEPDSTVSTVDTPSKPADGLTVSTVDTVRVSTVDTLTVSTVDTVLEAPYRNAPGIELIQDRERQRKTLVLVDAGVEREPDHESQPESNQRNRIVAHAESLAPLEGASSKIDGWLNAYPADWVEQAVLTAMASKPDKLWPYINKCLMHFKANGGPVKPDAEMPRDGPSIAARPAATPFMSVAERRRQAFKAQIAEMKLEQQQREVASGNG